jgi:hypothetical protein
LSTCQIAPDQTLIRSGDLSSGEIFAARLLGLAVGQMPGAVRGHGGKAKAIRPDAIGPARFPGARLIEANRHHPRGILSGAALSILTRQNGGHCS